MVLELLKKFFPIPLDGRFHTLVNLTGPIVLGLLVSLVFGWILVYGKLLPWSGLQPEFVQTVLYIVGAIIIIGIVTTNNFGYPKFLRLLISIVCVIGIFLYGIAIEVHWVSPAKSYFLTGGLIPASDAESWFSGAWRLLELNSLSAYDQIRPINAALHALRLVLTGDYQSSVMVTALIAGGASLFPALMLRRSLGWIAAGVFFVVSLSLIREHLPLGMTEIHGYIFGTLAFGLLWRSAVDRSILYFSLGLSLLSIALNIRSGPFLVLPAVLLWGGIIFSSNSRISIWALSAGTLGIAFGFSISKFFLILWGDTDGMLYSNFSYTLYGMAVGGKKWTQVLVDHPEILAIPYGPERRLEVYRLAIYMIQENPLLFVSYYLKQLDYFLLSFVKYDLVKVPYYFLFNVYQVITVIAGCWVVFCWREPLARLGILMFLGVLFSAPFLMQDAGVRPFAPVYPLFATIPAIAIGLMVRLGAILIGGNELVVKPIKEKGGHILLLGILPILVVVVGPVIAVAGYQQPVLKADKCPLDQIGLITHGVNSVVVNVFDDQSLANTRVPNIRRSDFFDTLPGNLSIYRERLENHSLPFAVVLTRKFKMLVVEGLIQNNSSQQIKICVRERHSDGYAHGYVFGESLF